MLQRPVHFSGRAVTVEETKGGTLEHHRQTNITNSLRIRVSVFMLCDLNWIYNAFKHFPNLFDYRRNLELKLHTRKHT